MSEVFKVPANLLLALIVLTILLLLIFISLGFSPDEERVYIGRNGCKNIGIFIFRAMQVGGILTGGISEMGITTFCDLIPF